MMRAKRRAVVVWTWDYGTVRLDPDRDPATAAFVLEKVLHAGLWDEFRKFPPAIVRRLLRRIDLPSSTRRVVRLYLEEHAA